LQIRKGPRQRANSQTTGDYEMNIPVLPALYHLLLRLWKWAASAGVGIVAIKGFPMALRRLYTWVLLRYEETYEQLKAEAQKHTAATSFSIPPEQIVKKTRLPHWLVMRALRWNRSRRILAEGVTLPDRFTSRFTSRF
jgi:hypothetical protein